MSILNPLTQAVLAAGRATFTKFLSDPATLKSANGVTLKVVSAMNNQMVKKGVGMSEAHRKVAEESILRGDTICQFLSSENRHVLDSNGNGVVYHTGKYFHSYVVKNLNNCPKQ